MVALLNVMVVIFDPATFRLKIMLVKSRLNFATITNHCLMIAIVTFM